MAASVCVYADPLLPTTLGDGVKNWMSPVQRKSNFIQELMNKVLHDQPDDPLVYLIRMLYRKAALPVPKDLKPGTLRRSSPERHGRRSPDKTSTQAWAVASGPDLVDRSYDKPWQTHSKKPKSRDTEKMDGTKAGRKQKQGWVSDTKLTTTTFDDLFEEDQRHEDTVKHHRREDKTDIRKAWATNVGVMDGEDANYRSRGYTGPRCQRDNEDPLAGEIMLSETVVTKEESPAVESSSHKKGHKMDSLKHREELGKLLTDTDKSSTASGDSGMYESDENEDDAIELLEDPDDLRREGVTKISKTGYKLSRVLRQREQEQHNVKLNINLFTGNAPANSQLGSEYDYYDSDLERPQTGMSFQQSDYSPGISDDEFESVSQVVGPRHPVWGAGDYDDENVPKFSRTLPEPSRQQQRSGKLASTIPVRFQEQPNLTRSEDTNVFLKGGKPWDPKMYSSQDEPMVENQPPPAPAQVRDSVRSVRSERSAQSPIGVEGGWHIPDDTEVSLATEWTAQSSGRPDNGPPKAY